MQEPQKCKTPKFFSHCSPEPTTNISLSLEFLFFCEETSQNTPYLDGFQEMATSSSPGNWLVMTNTHICVTIRLSKLFRMMIIIIIIELISQHSSCHPAFEINPDSGTKPHYFMTGMFPRSK